MAQICEMIVRKNYGIFIKVLALFIIRSHTQSHPHPHQNYAGPAAAPGIFDYGMNNFDYSLPVTNSTGNFPPIVFFCDMTASQDCSSSFLASR